MRQKDIRPAPARIEFKGMKFLITDRPSDVTIPNYIMVCVRSSWAGRRSRLTKNNPQFQELKKNNVSVVVRVCEPSYKTEELESQSITVRDLPFEDGTSPPQSIVEDWFEVLRQK